MNQFRTITRESALIGGFWVGQAIILTAFVSLPWARAARLQPPPVLPAVIRSEPLPISPRYNLPEVVSDEQLEAVLHKLRPRLRQSQPKISVLDHALRCWGPDAEFSDPECLSGLEMQSVLLNHNVYSRFWGEDAAPLLYPEEHGITVRTREGAATASHVDHTLATLAEVGVPLHQRIRTPQGSARVQDIFVQAVRGFSLNQQECEWTVLALALYSPNSSEWLSKEQQSITFDLLSERLMRQEIGEGVCFGNHRLYTLAVLLRVQEEHPILKPSTLQAVHRHLLDATGRLVRTQHADGWWDFDWAENTPTNEPQKLASGSRRLLATGHALEWWAIAPDELLPPREVIVRAGQWLVREIERLDEGSVDRNYTFLSHVGRALALWRGVLPADVQVPADCSSISVPAGNP